MSTSPPAPAGLAALLEPLTAAPSESAVLLDLDGTLAPIVPRPEQTRIPAPAAELLARISGRYGLTAIVTGRRAADARRIAGIDSIACVGNHGYEMLAAGADAPEPVPALAGHERDAPRFADAIDAGRLEGVGLRTEDKGPIVALHWRGAADESAAAATAAEIAAEAHEAGLHTHDGRKVLELRPPVEIDKGAGIAALLERGAFAAALYAGDDRTDLDGFRALRRLAASGALGAAVAVAVVADETPAEVAEGADITVEGPQGFLAVLEALA